ncbi:MAG: sigma-70 family RNA polymerase sigma factor [Eubacteriales bacterium]|nr:sigma-70 family RNA polymerase sigma factor [Eubacteriales bacterium]
MKCDAAKFAGMYEMIYKDLYRFALCMMRNPQDAEDAVSESVVRGYEHVSSLRSEGAFKSWMFTILSNVCRKKLAVMAKQRPVSEIEFFEEALDGSGEETMNLSLDVRRAFAVLSEEEQMIVGLSVFGGYQSKEIGKILKLKDGTVRSKRSRALEKMSVILSVGTGQGQTTYGY